MSQIFDKTTHALGASLDFRLQRHNLTSANIANAETPGFKAKKMDFEDSLARAVDLQNFPRVNTSHEGHMPIVRGAIERVVADVYDNPDGNVSNDGNTVDLEKEMSKLSENNILYRSTIELMKKKLGAMKYAVGEGGL